MTVQLQPFPSSNSGAVGANGSLENIWYYLLRTIWQRLGGSGATLPVQAVTLDSSPFQYSTDISGTLVVQGGTVSAVSVIRGGTTVSLGITSGAVPLLRGDIAQVTYSVAPTLTFLPSEFIQSST